VALRQEEFTSLCDDVDLDRDRALVERCQAGDSAAFGNLYARYYERLLRFCLRRLNDRHEAEDAAQEAFARAWKALPNFAGERRFYPWLTVIAGNICTDMLRRRSRSTPTDDVELGSHHPVGAGSAETSEELVLAAVDGELVTRALGRLSSRHRHVLAMREGSGWTYQQIADHEGVEIGTIETLLWRARQALKREFTVLSESKGALAGFLAGAGALVKRTVFRVAHKGSMVQGSGSGGGLRNAVIGGAVTSAAVAAALITPHALSPSHSAPSQQAAPAGPSIAGPNIPPFGTPAPSTTPATADGSNVAEAGSFVAASTGTGTAGGVHNTTSLHAPPAAAGGSGSGSGNGGPLSGTPISGVPNGGLPSGTTNPIAGLTGPLSGVTGAVSGVTAPVIGGLGQVTTSLANTVGGLASTLGLNQVLTQLGLGSSSTGSTTTPTTNPIAGAVAGVTGTVNKTVTSVGSTLNQLLGKK
jgi:RNA polymerase sigma-70 factor (ECF subfamily)